MRERPWETAEWATQVVWQRDEPEPDNVFNVLAVFTSDCAFNDEGGEPIERDELIGNIRLCITQMNEAFERSGVDVRGNLVSIVQFAAPPPFLGADMYRDAMLGEPASEQERELRKQGPSYPELAEFNANIRRTCLDLRAEHEAHVVLFVSGNGGDPIAGALGAVDRNEAFVVVPHTKLLDGFAPAHEIGHLFGCEHNRESVQVRAHASCYGYCTPHWRTIMAYNPHHDRDLPIIGHFSNPAVDYDDGQHGPLPTGATGAHAANNVAQINGYTATILGLRG
ncbi:M12 family metallo-peptidase [Corallococcus exercitus]|uniref:M12 family metallo-peptidase n=1 Tax=Corallococcus exercitus TaxID=2316736 RepID=UPI0035D4EBE1